MLDAAFPPIRCLARLASSFIASAALVGCAPPAPGTPVGVSDAVPEPSPQRAEPPPLAPSAFAAALAWPEAGPPFRSLAHRRDGTLVRVRIDPAVPDALVAYRRLSDEAGLQDGARVIAWHETPAGRLLGGYLLEKRSGTWSALEVDAGGSVIPGDRTSCVRCHDMAPTDHLFGLPTTEAAAVNANATSDAQ